MNIKYMIKKVININSLNEINEKDITNSIIYINIDSGCLIPEYLIAQVYNNNPFIRNKIIKNTNKIKFNYTDKLIPTRHNFNNFIKFLETRAKDIYYVTKDENIDSHKIKNNLDEFSIPIKKIININKINVLNEYHNKIVYIDSKVENLSFNTYKLKIYKLNIFN